MDIGSFDPLSDKFRRQATENIVENIAALRKKKDFDLRDDVSEPEGSRPAGRNDDEIVLDRLMLAKPETARKPDKGSARDSGHTSQDGLARDVHSSSAGQGQVASNRVRPQHEEIPLDAQSEILQEAAGHGLLGENDPSAKRRRDEEARRLAQRDVPAEILKASQDIVEGQMDPVKGPRVSLSDMKSVPDVASLETAPADFVAEMEIAESACPPCPLIQDDTG